MNSRTISLRSAYQAAIERDDLDSAVVALEALLEDVPESPEYRYQKALLDVQRGNTSAARLSMRSLALNAQHQAAIRWLLANDFDLTKVSHWTAEQHDEFRTLAEQVMSHEDRDMAIDGRLRMSKYLLATGAVSDALRLLTDLSNEHPPAALVAATICLQQGSIAEGRAHASVAKEYYSKQLQSKRDDTKTRLDLARALVLLGQEEQALRELSEGFKATEDPQLRVASAEAMVIWANRLGSQPEQTDRTLLQRLQLLHRASQCAPLDPHINAAIIGLVLECKDNKNAEVAALRKATAQGIDPESVHFARGTLALLEGRTEDAQSHLAQAAQRGTQMPATLNNMAMAIYHSVDGDMEMALRLADQAVELLPQHPYLNDTRGRILLRLKRFPEAIASLEKGLLAPELQPEIYANLATAYRQLGDTALAHEMEAMLAQADVSDVSK